MDVRTIIREMLKKGMTEEQIKESLTELGIENAEELVKQATEQIKEVSLSETAPKIPATQKPTSLMDETQPPKSLFGTLNEQQEPPASKPAQRPAASLQKQAPAPKEEPEAQGLAFTSVSDEGEKEVSVGELEKETGLSSEPVVTPMAATSLGDVDAVERKLDETIALLKALQDINKKILETERTVLLRLK